MKEKLEETGRQAEMKDLEFSIDRRNLLLGAGALGLGTLAAAVGGSPFANLAYAEEQRKGGKREAMIDAIHGCVKTGEACLSHCLDSFKTGDTAMANCAASVTEMLAFCTAHGRMASLDSKYTKEMCQLAIKVCGDCEKECRKHEKHPPCKACADACKKCIEECKKYIG
jgi:Cys-rich four helix bundle protein (predicted Tat secretion target)